MYFKIGEYKTAEQWISLYLSANENCAAAHKLHGQIFEKLKRPESQLVAYQRSLQLDKKQNDLLIEVCKLLQSEELSGYAASKGRYWYELAEARGLQDDVVLNLKLKYLNDGVNRTGSWENVHEIILKEIVQRPHDVGLRIRLVRHFLDQDKVDEAFKTVAELEQTQISQFRNSVDWYAVVLKVLGQYEAANESSLSKDWPYWLLLVTALDRQLFLTLCQASSDSSVASKSLNEASSLLFELDQALSKLTTLQVRPAESDAELLNDFLSHFRGQFCLHAATYLFKREQTAISRSAWRETTRSALPLLLLAYNCDRVSAKRPWLKGATKQTKALIRLWNAESHFRCCQAGRTLLSCVEPQTRSDNATFNNLRKVINDKISSWATSEDVINEIRRSTTDGDWRKKVFRLLFTNEQSAKLVHSYFVKCKSFETPEYIWPLVSDLETDEEVSQVIEAAALSRFVYLAIGYDALAESKSSSTTISPDVRCHVFSELNFSISNLNNCGAETLNQLDVDTFLYAATIQAKRAIELDKIYTTSSNSTAAKPRILPYANIAHQLCTEEQSIWWTAAYKVLDSEVYHIQSS